MNSFAGIFWLVLAQLQNRFFVEHLPVAAYVRCLKEKEWKKWNSVFLLYSVWHSSLWHGKVQSGKLEQIKNISASKMKKKLRTASFKQNLLVLIKKECIAWFKTNKPWRLKSRSTSTSWQHRHCCGAIPTLAPKAMVVIFLDKHVSVHSITFIITILEESFMIGYAPFWYQMETYNFIS